MTELVSDWRAIVEQTTDLVAIIDTSGTLRYQNPATERILGFEANERIGESAFDYVHPEDREQVVETFLSAKKSEKYTSERLEYRYQDVDGNWVWLESVGSNRPTSGEDGFVVISRDITEQKELERELNTALHRLDLALERADAGIWEWNVDTDELYWSDQLLEALGYSQAEFPGSFEFFGDKLHPDDAEQTEEAIDTALNTGEPYHVKQRIKAADGEYRWIDVRGQVVEDYGTTRMVGIGVNITKRKEYERVIERQRNDLKLLNETLRHDLRNDLSVIKGYADMLPNDVDDQVKPMVETIREATNKAIGLTETARDLADVMLQIEAEKKKIPLNDVLEAQLEAVRTGYPQATVTVGGSLTDISVEADELLESVFRNLLKNAIQHNDKDVPEVVVSVEESDDVVWVQIADNGPGIPDTRKEEIFNRGIKGLESGGTGLGLYLVETLVNRYGGDVWVEDNDPEGSVFVVELPIAE